MVDDQDRWEWMNVSFGTGSPKYSRTKGCKTVVVVVIVVVVKKGYCSFKVIVLLLLAFVVLGLIFEVLTTKQRDWLE